MILWRELDRSHNEVEIQMGARAIDAADAFYAGAMLRVSSAPVLYFLPPGMRSATGRVALRRYSLGRLGRVDLPVLASGAAGLAEHAQVQRYRADKKDYRNEVFLQSSPILEKPDHQHYGADFTKLPPKQHDLCQPSGN